MHGKLSMPKVDPTGFAVKPAPLLAHNPFHTHNAAMTIQYAIISAAIALAAAYAAWRIWRTLSDTQSGCYGCKGCALKEQMMKKNGGKHPKTRKFECFEKKPRKTFGR